MITLLLLARATYMYGVVLHAHPVRGESHNQRNTTGEVATQSSRQKGRNNARQPGTAELRGKAILSVSDATFGCYQLDCPQTEIAC